MVRGHATSYPITDPCTLNRSTMHRVRKTETRMQDAKAAELHRRGLSYEQIVEPRLSALSRRRMRPSSGG